MHIDPHTLIQIANALKDAYGTVKLLSSLPSMLGALRKKWKELKSPPSTNTAGTRVIDSAPTTHRRRAFGRRRKAS